jgi:hypothetical protein
MHILDPSTKQTERKDKMNKVTIRTLSSGIFLAMTDYRAKEFSSKEAALAWLGSVING